MFLCDKVEEREGRDILRGVEGSRERSLVDFSIQDWLVYVAASINSRFRESTGQSPLYIIFGVEKRLPYDLLSSSHSRVYNVYDYAKSFHKHS